MKDDSRDSVCNSVLQTKLEEDFILPLTAIRGALEILRDYPDAEHASRQRFVSAALEGCLRIEHGLAEMGAAVYSWRRPGAENAESNRDGDRVTLLVHSEIAELDFAGLDFDSAAMVNRVFDTIEERVAVTRRKWWFLVNYTGCHVFPEAWIAFAHRGRNIVSAHGNGTIRYDDRGEWGLPGRDRALCEIATSRAAMCAMDVRPQGPQWAGRMISLNGQRRTI